MESYLAYLKHEQHGPKIDFSAKFLHYHTSAALRWSREMLANRLKSMPERDKFQRTFGMLSMY